MFQAQSWENSSSARLNWICIGTPMPEAPSIAIEMSLDRGVRLTPNWAIVPSNELRPEL